MKEIKYGSSFEEFYIFINSKFKNIKYRKQHIELICRAIYSKTFDGTMKSPYMVKYPDIASAANAAMSFGFVPKNDKYPVFRINNCTKNTEEFIAYIKNNSFMWNNVEVLVA